MRSIVIVTLIIKIISLTEYCYGVLKMSRIWSVKHSKPIYEWFCKAQLFLKLCPWEVLKHLHWTHVLLLSFLSSHVTYSQIEQYHFLPEKLWFSEWIHHVIWPTGTTTFSSFQSLHWIFNFHVIFFVFLILSFCFLKLITNQSLWRLWAARRNIKSLESLLVTKLLLIGVSWLEIRFDVD